VETEIKNKPQIIIILGPTATGKSSLAIDLAKKQNGEIISADSMQVYKGMDIGTAKLSKKEQESVPHHLIDVKNPDEAWTVADFIDQVNKLIKDILNRGKTPIIVGGTGLYLNSFLEGFSFPIAPANLTLRKKLEKFESSVLWKKLNRVDPKASEKISEKDKKRIIRALEVYESTGKPISNLQKKNPIKDKYNIKLIGLNMDKEKLYKRIERRVDNMISKGLIDEVKSLMKKGYSKNLISMQALGYKEMIKHLEGNMDLEQTIALIKQKTRNFARRQMTWFRRFDNVHWFNALTGKTLTYIIRKVLFKN